MKALRTRVARFMLKHRNKGIPNLMLYIVIASAIVYFSQYITQGSTINYWLCFDKSLILKGQVWRLVTFLFTYTPSTNPFMVLIGYYFFYNLGRSVELQMGTLRFNLYYFTSASIMVIFAMIFCPNIQPLHDSIYINPANIYAGMASYLHLTLLLTFAAFSPDSTFLVMFIIPVKAWFMGLAYLIIIALEIYTTAPLFPHNLFPLAGICGFLLFAGKDILNLLPPALRPNLNRVRRPKAPKPRKVKTDPIPFNGATAEPKKATYMHRCVICGRTDVSDPDLEFRYCSRCNGYFCYCQDHINNHTHVE